MMRQKNSELIKHYYVEKKQAAQQVLVVLQRPWHVY